VNLVFELDQAPKGLAGMTLNGKAVTADAYPGMARRFGLKPTSAAPEPEIGVPFN
jgi:hypothetical protein